MSTRLELLQAEVALEAAIREIDEKLTDPRLSEGNRNRLKTKRVELEVELDSVRQELEDLNNTNIALPPPSADQIKRVQLLSQQVSKLLDKRNTLDLALNLANEVLMTVAQVRNDGDSSSD